MLLKRKLPKTLEDYLYEAKNQADLQRQNTLKIAIPFVAVGCLFGYPYIKELGVGAIALLSVAYCQKMGADIRRDWNAIDELDRATIYKFTPLQYRKGMKKALKSAPSPSVTNNTQASKPRALLPARTSAIAPSASNPLQPSPTLGGAAGGFDWVNSLIKFPSVAVFGGMGAGKSTFVKWLIEQRIALNHQIKVLDPHAKKNAWQGLEVIGKGNKYLEVENFLKWLNAECDRRYEKEANDDNPQFPVLTIVCEEMVKWESKIDAEVLGLFDQNCISELRKIRIKVIKVSHNDTLSCTGGKAGTKGTLAYYIRLYLETIPNPNTEDGVSPAFKGQLFYPHKDAIEVKINPEWKPCRLGATPKPNPPHLPLSPRVTPVTPSPSPHNSDRGDTLTPRQKIEIFIEDERSEKWILEDYFSLTKNSAKWREYRDLIRAIKRDRENPPVFSGLF
ncbi:MAG: hypothetical protein J7647_27535 [Cyanobacteria bacterium SBLK]|nr:hypothetical protein [Cyanobacteria bacterium SBLK]